MNTEKTLSIDECRKIEVDILKYVASVCGQNSIPYYMVII